MVGSRMSRKARRHFKKIQRPIRNTPLSASAIQTDLDKRQFSYDEALMLGNMIKNRPTRSQAMALCTPSRPDAYRRTLELYLRDALTRTGNSALGRTPPLGHL